MIEYIGKAAMLEQLAEEAAELAQAALKLARIERGENPTPVTKREAKAHLIEEFTDVETCAKELSLSADPDIEAMKIKRFYDRANTVPKSDPLDSEEIPFC
jgi:NTP pyrophosphatase (non-canonical NTP hydrolase)